MTLFFCISIVFALLIAYATAQAVRWHYTRFIIEEYVYDEVYNIFGELVGYKRKYVIRKGRKYYLCWKYPEQTRVLWYYDRSRATKFDTRGEAEAEIKDILDNPNKYILA